MLAELVVGNDPSFCKALFRSSSRRCRRCRMSRPTSGAWAETRSPLSLSGKSPTVDDVVFGGAVVRAEELRRDDLRRSTSSATSFTTSATRSLNSSSCNCSLPCKSVVSTHVLLFRPEVPLLDPSFVDLANSSFLDGGPVVELFRLACNATSFLGGSSGEADLLDRAFLA